MVRRRPFPKKTNIGFTISLGPVQKKKGPPPSLLAPRKHAKKKAKKGGYKADHAYLYKNCLPGTG